MHRQGSRQCDPPVHFLRKCTGGTAFFSSSALIVCRFPRPISNIRASLFLNICFFFCGCFVSRPRRRWPCVSLGSISGCNGRGVSEVAGKAVGVVCNVAPGAATCGPNCRERRRAAGPKHPTLVARTSVSTLVSTLVVNDPPTDPKH